MKDKLFLLLQKGFFHIFGANVLNKIFQFTSAIFLVRILPKEEFGYFSYAENLLMIFLLFNALGASAGMLQFGSETEDQNKKNAYFRFGIKWGYLFNLIITLIIVVFGLNAPLKLEEARILIIAMCVLPIVMFTFEIIQAYFRVSLENKSYSFLTSTNTFFVLIFSVMGAYYFQSIGIVLFKYVAFFITIIIGLVLIKKNLLGIIKANELLINEKISFIKFSLSQSFNNAISQMLYVIDIFMIGIIITDASILASYKTATLIPFALNFIPISIMVFIYPYFAKKNSDIIWIKNNYIKLTKYLITFNLLITFTLILCSPWLIPLLFGEEYVDSIKPFIILSIGYFFAASFRIPVGNILVMMKKVKFGLYLSLITGILNILLNYILISSYGSIGAAISTLTVFIFTSALGLGYLIKQLNKG
ncbi:hypothetical protein BHE17_11930 [Planococcus maritimus]|uniref:oligosaccharide flippase family protein n=1 Tax=Planococcus maritimus TaxID=192421 RepID=UPI00084C19EB|nr:polysaccharide biosynthesis C-terminal domain-containing protein [Planococcus maritimus]OED33121.1 hypothetical protein BHE17_11930 [Planococcus maritimus]